MASETWTNIMRREFYDTSLCRYNKIQESTTHVLSLLLNLLCKPQDRLNKRQVLLIYYHNETDYVEESSLFCMLNKADYVIFLF